MRTGSSSRRRGSTARMTQMAGRRHEARLLGEDSISAAARCAAGASPKRYLVAIASKQHPTARPSHRRLHVLTFESPRAAQAGGNNTLPHRLTDTLSSRHESAFFGGVKGSPGRHHKSRIPLTSSNTFTKVHHLHPTQVLPSPDRSLAVKLAVTPTALPLTALTLRR
jgi:hypothetical protein